MPAARTIFAIIALTFTLLIGITVIVPSFPPAQILYEYAGIPQTTLSIWGMPIATLLSGITNGCFFTIIVITAYGLAQLVIRRRRRPLAPLPVAPHLTASPLENPLVESLGDRTPPALVIPSASSGKVRKESGRFAIIKRESVPIRVSKMPIGAELAIETIQGIGPVCGALLRNLGIATVSDLLRVGATEHGRSRLAKEVGVTSATLLRWVCRGDLLRVNGIGSKYSELLESAGVKTVTDLSMKNPRYLSETLKVVNRERNLVRRTPPSKTIEIWVHNARNLEPILVE